MSGTGTAGAAQRLSAAALRGALIAPGSFWRVIDVTPETGSTNADLLAAAARGAPEGAVLVAESQTAGRGRMGRSWVSAPGAGLTLSVLLRPAAVPVASRGWVPLLAGVAVARAVRSQAAGPASAARLARLKWPNDVLVGGAKLAGILAERSGEAIVVGIGINVTAAGGQLPGTAATSLALQGVPDLDRQPLLIALLGQLAAWYQRWSRPDPAAPAGLPSQAARPRALAPGDAAACGLRAEYLGLCDTLGRSVRVLLPGGRVLAGTAADVDDTGRLVVATAGGPAAVSAGDVIHVR